MYRHESQAKKKLLAHAERLPAQKRATKRWVKPVLIGLAVAAGVFLLANIVMGFLYRGKVLPNYSVANVAAGGIPFDQLDERIAPDQLLPKTVTLMKDDRKQEVAPADLGVGIDWPATREELKKQRSWLPLLSLLQKHSVSARLSFNEDQFNQKTVELGLVFTKPALPERIVFAGENFSLAAPESGFALDPAALKSQAQTLIAQGQNSIEVPVTTTAATEPTGKLGGELALLQKRLDTSIALKSGGKTKKLSRAEIGQFYEPAGQTMQFSTTQMDKVIAKAAAELGVTPINQTDAVHASLYALTKQQPVTFVLAGQNARVYRYCPSLKSVSANELFDFKTKLAAVYGDPRGWNSGGAIAFVYAESNCDFIPWLSAPQHLPEFGSICDTYYSCRVGRNVMINFDRWRGATDPWNAAGGSLEDYRVMVINHETGHWLGFGHANCPGAGQPAPVMQQQSISLQGCSFNPWPTAAELSAA